MCGACERWSDGARQTGDAGERIWRASATLQSVYFQREEAGSAMSALFLANGVDVSLIGCNRLLTGDVGDRPFVFQGAVGPVDAAGCGRPCGAPRGRLRRHGTSG